MIEIPLTQGKVALVDDEDFERVNAFKWCADWSYSTKSFYARRKEKKKTIFMERLIMQTPNNMTCDHINHDTLDNRKNNLRNCTRAENARNRRLFSNNRLRVKGIRQLGKSYQARVKIAGKDVFCKTFPTLEEAVAAYAEAIKKYHGEFANTR